MGFGKDFKFGDKVTQGSPIPKLKVDEGEIKYVTILSLEEAKVSRIHYLNPIGYFHCSKHIDEDGIEVDGLCCKLMSELRDVLGEDSGVTSYASEKLNLPVAIFKVGDDGKTPELSTLSFGRLELNSTQYQALLDSAEEEEIDIKNLHRHLIRIKGGPAEGKGQFKRVPLNFRVRAEKSPVYGSDVMKAKAKNFLAEYHTTIDSVLGKTLPDDKLTAIIEARKSEAKSYEAPAEKAMPVAKSPFDDDDDDLLSSAKSTPAPVIETKAPDYDDAVDLSFLDDDDFLSDSEHA